MPGTSQCPKCEQKITLPRSTHPETQVQCPLCDEEYALGEALDLAPPMLIVLKEAEPVGVTDGEGGASFDSPWGNGDSSTATQDFTRPTPDQQGDDYELEIGASTDTEVDSDSATDTDSFSDDFSDAFSDDADTFSDEKSGEEAEFEPFGDVPVAVGEANDESPMFGDSADVPTMAPLSKRKKSKGSNFLLRQIVGVFGGGAIGLTFGYMIILWVKGPTGDFLKVGRSLPSFMVPASFAAANDSSSATPLTVEQEIAARPEFAGFAPKKPKPAESTEIPTIGEPDSGPDETVDEPEPNPILAAVENATADGGNLEIENISALIGPTNIKGHTASELSAALKGAAKIKDKLKVTGDWGKEEGAAYMKFCQLAETMISIKDPNETGLQLQARRNAARDILQEFSAQPHVVTKLGETSKKWFGRTPRINQGVLLAGKIESVTEEGAFYAVEVIADGTPITVITRDKPKWNEGEELVVLGAIVDEPQFNLGGYTGEADTVVWSELSLGTSK